MQDLGYHHVTMRVLGVGGDGNLAGEVGAADLTVEADGSQSSTVSVKYVVIWSRQAGGPWQLAVDNWNSDASV